MQANQPPEQWESEHISFVIRATGPRRMQSAEGEVLGLASVPLRAVLHCPGFRLHTTL